MHPLSEKLAEKISLPQSKKEKLSELFQVLNYHFTSPQNYI
jgi:hypothetical protein